jgi:hypothetical protein
MKWYEYAWMIGFGIACGSLMIREGVFNGIVIIPLIPLIGKGIGAMMKC